MSKQHTEYRLRGSGTLLAVVHEHVRHSMGEALYIQKHGRMVVDSIVPVVIQRLGNNVEDCEAVHVVEVREWNAR